jgi:hypothetical protein
MRTRTLTMCLVILLTAAAPALGHVGLEYAPAGPPAPAPPLDAQALSSATPTLTGVWALIAAVAVAAVALARRRRAVALACVALLALIAFETGLHSVHHIGDQPGSSCVIASASAQTGALTVDRTALERPTEVTTPVVVSVQAPTTARSAAPDLGRAPPAA